MTGNNITDFEGCSSKELRRTACDPEEAIGVEVYSKKTGKTRMQYFKRRKLIGRILIYKGVDGGRYPARIIGFDLKTGSPAFRPMEGKPAPEPVQGTILLVE